MTAVRCIVFDIDDTLYLEREYIRSGFGAVGAWAAEHLGLQDFGARAWAEFEAGRRGDVFDRVLRECAMPNSREIVEALVRVYRHHAPLIALLADARACLLSLEGRCRLAALTDGPLESQRAKASALGLDRWLKPVVYTAALGERYAKPSPRGFRVIEAAVMATGRECAYVADNPAKDFEGPATLGWRTVRIRRPESLHVEVESGPLVQSELQDLDSLGVALGITA